MPKLLLSKTKAKSDRDFLSYKTPANPQGKEGKELTERIEQIQKDQPLLRLIQALENRSDKRHQALYDYLESLRSEAGNEFTELVLDLSWQIWQRLRSYFQAKNLYLEVPDACPGYQDNLMFTWSNKDHYLECEVFGNKDIEFFYRNNNNNDVWGEDIKIEQELSPDIVDKLSNFAW